MGLNDLVPLIGERDVGRKISLSTVARVAVVREPDRLDAVLAVRPSRQRSIEFQELEQYPIG